MDNLQPHDLKEEEILPAFTSCSCHLSHADSHFWTALSRFLAHFSQAFQHVIQSPLLYVRTGPLQLGHPGSSSGVPTSEVQTIAAPAQEAAPAQRCSRPLRDAAQLPSCTGIGNQIFWFS